MRDRPKRIVCNDVIGLMSASAVSEVFLNLGLDGMTRCKYRSLVPRWIIVKQYCKPLPWLHSLTVERIPDHWHPVENEDAMPLYNEPRPLYGV